MPSLNFSGDVFIGTNDGTIGINMSDTNGVISYTGGLINYGGYKYPIIAPSFNGSYALSNSDSIVLLNTPSGRGAAMTVTLPSTPLNGKIFYFRRIDATGNTTTISAGGSDVIRLASTSSVTSFTVAANEAYTLAYGSGTWWLIRNGGSAYYAAPPPGPPPG